IHTVDADTRNVVAHGVVLVVGRGARDGSSHAVLVVLDQENSWQLPQRSHVCSLPDLTLVRSTVTVHGDTNVHLLARGGVVFVGESQAHTHGDLSADNARTTVEVVFLADKLKQQ